MDIEGIVLFVLCLSFILTPISLGKHWPELWWLLLGSVPSGILLWKVEKSRELADGKPILPPSLFKTPMVINGFVSLITVTFTYPGYLFVTALCLQSEIGFTPFESGNSFIALGVMYFIGSLISKPLSKRIGDHKVFALGAIFSVIGFLGTIYLFYKFNHDLKFYYLWIATGAVGFGDSIRMTSAYRIALSRVGKHLASEASSALVTLQQGCAALGTAFTGSIYSFTLFQGYLSAITISISIVSFLILAVGIPNYIKISRKLKEGLTHT